jgi:hypothetical protein
MASSVSRNQPDPFAGWDGDVPVDADPVIAKGSSSWLTFCVSYSYLPFSH